MGSCACLETTGEVLRGKHAVVVGASNHVGRPMALELLLAGCTVTICHSATRDLPEQVAQADIVVAAVGRPEMIKGEWIKTGACVIDIGINRLEDGRIVRRCGVRRGQGTRRLGQPGAGRRRTMTVATLLRNTMEAALKHP